jgi:riboflavin synthase
VFTGIIEDIGKVKAVEKSGTSGKIMIGTAFDLSGIKTGASIAVNGACMTVVDKAGAMFGADVSAETFSATTLGSLRPGDAVNVESALKLGSPLGGHLVTGHVDGTGVVKRLRRLAEFVEMEVDIPETLLGQVVRKGSVAIDGVSLTIADLTATGVVIALIPHTLEATTLHLKREGDAVNVETDIIGKYVERFLKGYRPGNVTEGFLKEHGFIRE